MKRTNDEIMNDFLDLACALSPENLYCDGEASNEEVKKIDIKPVQEVKKTKKFFFG